MVTVARVPDLERVRARRLGGPLGTAAAVGAAALALRLRDPHQSGSWGLCPFKALTGWNCPLCGGLRAVNDLGHGQLSEAAHSNLFFVGILLPLAAGFWLLWLRRSWRGGGARLSPRTAHLLTLVLGALAVVFWVYRNTPWGSAWQAA